jgi:hypothetical protein
MKKYTDSQIAEMKEMIQVSYTEAEEARIKLCECLDTLKTVSER